MAGALFTVSPVVAQQRATVENAQGFLDQTVSRTGIKEDNLSEGSGTLIRQILSFSGIAFFLVMVYAGLLWMTAQGNTERVDKARNTLIAAGIGMVVVVSSFAVTNFVIERLQAGATGSGGGPGAGQIGGDGGAGQNLGCCLDKTGGNELIGNWTWRLTTEGDCRTRGTDENDPQDVHFGADDWEYHAGENAAQCEQRFSNK